jgi:hypothetical protein
MAAVSAEPVRERLRTGAIAPVVHRTPLALEVVARARDGRFELLKLALPAYTSVAPEPTDYYRTGEGDLNWEAVQVRLSPAVNAFAFIGTADDPYAAVAEYEKAYRKRSAQRAKARLPPEPYQPPSVPVIQSLWLRRLASNEPVTGTLYTPASRSGQPGHELPFSAQSKPSLPDSGALPRAWGSAAASHFNRRSGAFFRFASARLKKRYSGSNAEGTDSRGVTRSGSELARLMDTTTGRISIQEALEAERPLYLGQPSKKANVPIDKVKAPELQHHPWPALLQALARVGAEEPLARATPAEFYFVRASEFGKVLDLAEVVDDWGQPAADLLDSRSVERGTFARYETELGLERTALGRVLGPAVVSDLAIVGSDPYIHEGTDVTVLFRIKNGPLFEAALAATLASRAAGHGALTSSQFVEDGVTVQVTRSDDGRVRRHRASLAGIELVSNSAVAIRRVISTLKGRHPRLSDEPDFKYMLARDADTSGEVLAYMGDRFVATVVGPAQKIAEARRQLALAELSAPGYAALLSGWLDGASPKAQSDLTSANWLGKAELRHADGAPIDWQPGRAARSKWGRPDALEPLIELPPVTFVTEAEQRGYDAFAWSYAAAWSDKVDPIALRVSQTAGADKTRTLTAELRVLPLLRGEYREWLEMVGRAKVRVPELQGGARAVLGIGKEASLRRELNQLGRNFIGGERVQFDWIGDFALLGVANRNELVNALKPELTRELERPGPDTDAPRGRSFEQTLRGFPAYAVIALKSRVAAGIALTALRQKLSESAPDMAAWGEAPSYRGNAIVRVSMHGSGESAELFYSLMPSALALSLNEAALHEAIDQLAEHPPAPTADAAQAARAGQVVFELSGDKNSALYGVLAWLVSQTALESADRSRSLAEAVLRGAPEIANDPAASADLMRAYFGAVSRTPDGRAYLPGPDAPRDPLRGTPHAPVWPEVPGPGSPAERVLAQLAALRTEVAFDDEPALPGGERLQSLRTRVVVKLRR